MNKSSKNGQKVLVILGMHRSGTSAVSRVVNLLGVDLGSSLLPPAPDNPTGFWEHKEIVEINERLFYVLGRHWTSYLTSLPDKWWLRQDIQELQQRLVGLVQRDFGQSMLWGLKDPRLCRLLPLWLRVFSQINCRAYCLHTIRNPLEVADSLGKRDRLPRNVSFILWLQHVLEAERETRDLPRTFITYDRLLEDWRSTVRGAAKAFHWDWDDAIDVVGPQVDAFLNPRMRHHDRTSNLQKDYGSMPGLVAAAYEVLVRASTGDEESLATVLDGVSLELNAGLRSSVGELVVPELESQISRSYAADADLADLNSKLTICRAELDRVAQTWSWKLTSPLRRFYDYWTRKQN
ncbi:MAG: hypothetical protein HY913_03680 [Desulfomonile tiedjei]|nr:hypothetical protein [Desulfomonile tiedjei]